MVKRRRGVLIPLLISAIAAAPCQSTALAASDDDASAQVTSAPPLRRPIAQAAREEAERLFGAAAGTPLGRGKSGVHADRTNAGAGLLVGGVRVPARGGNSIAVAA